MNVFAYKPLDDGVGVTLSQERRRFIRKTESEELRIKEWASDNNPEVLRGLSILSDFLLDEIDHEKYSIVVPSNKIAELTELEAQSLNLPPTVPFLFRVYTEGNPLDTAYKLRWEFLNKSSKHVLINEQIGSIIQVGKSQYRVPTPMFEIMELLKDFPDDLDGKLETIASINNLLNLDNEASDNVAPDDTLVNIKLRHVAGFSSSVTGSLQDPKLTPVLFAKHLVEQTENSGEILDEVQQILSVDQRESFNYEFLVDDRPTKRTYLLRSGEYIYIDPSVRPSLEAFRKVCNSGPEIRRAFVKSPAAMLAEFIEDTDDAAQIIGHSFVETSQFSDRVIEINEWRPPDLPFLARESNDWGTEILIFEQVGSATQLVVPKEKLPDAVEKLKTAIDQNQKTFQFEGTEVQTSRELLDKMAQFLTEKPDPDPKSSPEPERRPTLVVVTLDNFEALNYERKNKPPINPLHYATPRNLVPATTLMDHQVEGVKWLIGTYNDGFPGALMADDMGLGKTLQALCFLSLYREQTPVQDLRPILIVAPTGLLNNWIKEITDHLGLEGLGEIEEAFGSGLRQLRTGSQKGKDTDHGIAMLDVQRLRHAHLILTTYESLRDYQVSFSQLDLDCVIFDEIQKTKNPKSLLSCSARSLKGKFQIGLSGTPVENSLADLWTILDVIAPGMLNYTLKQFLSLYDEDPDPEDPNAKEALEKLQGQLLKPENNKLPLILRRMKDKVFKGVGPDGSPIPNKNIHPASVTCQMMPPEQARLYIDYSNKLHADQASVIEALHAWKRISLCPRNLDEWEGQGDLVESSARLNEVFRLLDEIHAKNEKVLLFVESRKIQPILAQLVKERYGLLRLPLTINGAVSGAGRQIAVNEFQTARDGFNAILISPKAGGVGLTLTAANHVIHVERWWNPAVEDQCNDRSYRIGQKKDVHIYTPMARHPDFGEKSFDLVLDAILTRKRELAANLFIPTELNLKRDFDIMFEESQEATFSPLTLEELCQLETGEDFEEYIARCIKCQGAAITMTPRSHDAGCDLIAIMNNKRILIQCKQVQSMRTLRCGVDEIISAKERYENVSGLALITNALQITGSQTELARENDVLTLTGRHWEFYGQKLVERFNDL